MAVWKKIYMYAKIWKPVRDGFTPGMARTWVRMQASDDDSGNVPERERKRAHDRGFRAETMRRLDALQKEKASSGSPAREPLSERDYLYLYPLNGQYVKWLTDLVTVQALYQPFSARLIPCFYQFLERDGELFVIPMDGLPAGYDWHRESVFRLIRMQGAVELTDARKNRYIRIAAEAGGRFRINGAIRMDETQLLLLFRKYAAVSVLRAAMHTGRLTLHEGGSYRQLLLYVINEHGDDPAIAQAVLERWGWRPREAEEEPEDNAERDTGEAAADQRTPDHEDEIDNADEADLPESELSRKAYRRLLAPYRIDRTELLETGVVDTRTGAVRTGGAGNGTTKQDTEDLPETPADDAGAYIPQWEEISRLIDAICRYTPQLEFFGVRIDLPEHPETDTFHINRFMNHPPYPAETGFAPVLERYLKRKYREKAAVFRDPAARRQRSAHKVALKLRRMFTGAVYPEGLKPYLGLTWIQDVAFDFFHDRSVPVRQKLWGYRHGFFSYRLPQYGITPENHLEYISDFEYKWMRHINNRYRVWLEDKMTIRYVCRKYADCFPDYYYYTAEKNHVSRIIPLMDCPAGYGNALEDIFRLVREKKSLALKMVSGSHGDGFYHLSYEAGMYRLNGEESSEEQVGEILMNPENQYLITEYIRSHPDLRRIYDGAVSTLRFEVFKPDGRTPETHDCYMRIGTSETGAVDNIGAGGMYAEVDIDTGFYHNAALMRDMNIIPTPVHPDTGVLVEGYIPHWEKVKQLVLDVTKELPQLEYLGVDVAVTEDGVKFPEINRYPDFPRMDRLSGELMQYLLYKLEKKKERYGYDARRPFRVITLPER